MLSFGDILRSEREARGVSFEEVKRSTRIGHRYLAALEKSEIDALPGGAFNTGYIRSYAESVGVDPEPALAAYHRALNRRELAALAAEEKAGATPKRAPKVSTPGVLYAKLLAGAAIAVTGIVLTWLVVWPISNADTAVGARTLESAHTGVADRPPSGARSDRAPVESHRAAGSAAIEPRSSESLPSSAAPVDPEPEPGAAALAVTEFGVGTAVVDRRLVGKSDRFLEGTRVRFWTRVVGGTNDDVVRHVWLHEGRVYMNAALPIGGPHWRTHSGFRLPEGEPGTWRVVAQDAEGRELASYEFVCLNQIS